MPDGEIQALLFDFNGTLSDDAPGLLRIYRQITSEMGLPFRETLIPIVMALPDADIFGTYWRPRACLRMTLSSVG